jgi:hypothetical protein
VLISEGLLCTKMVQLGRSKVSADSRRLRNSLSRESASGKPGWAASANKKRGIRSAAFQTDDFPKMRVEEMKDLVHEKSLNGRNRY